MSSMNDAASWLTTSARCARRLPGLPVARPPPLAIARTGSLRKPSRGAQANTRASAIDTISVKLRTQPSSAISPVRLVNRLAYLVRRSRPATASPRPSTPPTIDSTRFSASS